MQRNSLLTLSTTVRKSHNANWLKNYFENGELMPNRKQNTHFENHFHHLKIPTWLVIQKYCFPKIIIK